MTWAVLCDFDKTITTRDATDALLEAYAHASWHDIETDWEQGKIGSRECMQRQIALVHASQAQVDTLADTIPVDAHFAAFAALCKRNHVPLIILSDGIDLIIKRVLHRLDLSYLPVIASHLAPMGDDRWSLSAPFASALCESGASTCKCSMAGRIRATTGAENILYIGDGRSDFCVSAQEADLILAKDSLLQHCEKNLLPHQAFNNFAQASLTLEALVREHKQQTLPTYAQEALYA